MAEAADGERKVLQNQFTTTEPANGVYCCYPRRVFETIAGMNRLRPVVTYLLLLSCLKLNAQQPPAKTPLVIVCDCDDLNSRTLETAVRDVVAGSPRYYEVHPDREDKTAYYRLVLVALDDTPQSIAVSVVVLHGDSFMTSAVRICGINRMAWCAGTILSSADHAIQSH